MLCNYFWVRTRSILAFTFSRSLKSIIVMLCEFIMCSPIRYFSFLYTWFGRGWFYLFCGSQCVGLARDSYAPVALIMGLGVMVYGFLLMLIAIPLRKWEGPKPLINCMQAS